MDYIHRKIASHYALYRRSLVKGAILSLSGEGTLLSVETSDDPDSIAGVEFYSGILIPDMVNAHCHLELSHMRGALQGGEGFAGFARGMAAVRHDIPRHYVALQASVEDARLWAEGVGAVGDICNSTDTFGIKRESRIEYINFLELFGLGQTSADGLIPLAQAASEASLPYTVTPHSTYSLNDAAFMSAVRGFEGFSAGFRVGGEAGCNRLPLSVHFMESHQEAEMFRKQGALWDWNTERGMAMPFTDIYDSPADRITTLVPPERDIMLVHNCCVTEEEIDKVLFHFKGKVTWVLCPRSNEFISHIAPPVSLLRRKGARIAVGTDSLASNSSLSMAGELKCFKGVPVEELLCWATENGAQALNSEKCSGSFETGRRTGVVRVTGIDLNNMSVTDRLRMERII